jgi:Fe-S-cluster-containing hydrogenase component 2
MSSSGFSQIWIARDYTKCSGCRRCEIACSLFHEGKIWPEASRIRVFMLIPTVEIPHLCAQCDDAPCITSCPVKALSLDAKTGAIIVNKEACIACGSCINACPGKVPSIHPMEKYALICDLCGGRPQCVEVCQEGGYNALWVAKKIKSPSYKLYAKQPKDIVKDIAYKLYGRQVAEKLM